MNTTEEATGRIEITERPSGEAPAWVRNAWIGLTLPCLPICGFSNERDRGVVSGKELPINQYGFSIPQDKALEILKCSGQHKAAQYWEEQGCGKPGEYFGFSEEEAQIISGVTRQTIRMWPEEGLGNHDVRNAQ
ncbi:MAG: hypothetical protein RJA61_643 [Candidatus Parcubacteria bacterium]|jgi:hypothetical protein